MTNEVVSLCSPDETQCNPGKVEKPRIPFHFIRATKTRNDSFILCHFDRREKSPRSASYARVGRSLPLVEMTAFLIVIARDEAIYDCHFDRREKTPRFGSGVWFRRSLPLLLHPSMYVANYFPVIYLSGCPSDILFCSRQN